MLVTPLYAPTGCAAPVVIDHETLRRSGSLTLKAATGSTGFIMRGARGEDEDRPWSPAPKRLWTAHAVHPAAEASQDREDAGAEP